jgi:LDH2 family malate/lactate/ureidoglycolate dehydrogenase
VVALDPSRFQPLAQFKAEVDRHIRELRQTKALPGKNVRLPGENERSVAATVCATAYP